MSLIVKCLQLVVFLQIFFLLSGSQALAGKITLVTPMEKSIIYARSPSTHVMVKVEDKEDLKKLQVESTEGKISPRATRNNGKVYYVHFRVPLKPGKNTFTLQPINKTITIKYKPLRTLLNAKFDNPDVYLYHRKDTMGEECKQCHEVDSVPDDFFVHESPFGHSSPVCYTCHKSIFEDTLWQHSPAANLLCETCHKQVEGIGRISVAIGKDSDLCYQCHLVKGKVWGKMAYVHQPVGFGVCAICHNPHGDRNRFQLWAEGRGELCVSCHVDKEILLTNDTEGLTVHGIIRGGGCTTCHDPHATNNPYMLYKPVNELCTGCHNDLLGVTKGHPVGGHPLKGPSNPLHPDKEFNCASCHNPHSSEYKYLLVGDIIGGHVCSKCHN